MYGKSSGLSREKLSRNVVADAVRSGQMKIARNASADHGVIHGGRAVHAGTARSKVATNRARNLASGRKTESEARHSHRISRNHGEKVAADAAVGDVAAVGAGEINNSNSRQSVVNAANARSVPSERNGPNALSELIGLRGPSVRNDLREQSEPNGRREIVVAAGDVVAEIRRIVSVDQRVVVSGRVNASRCVTEQLRMSHVLSRKCETLRQNQRRHAKLRRNQPL